MNCVYSDVSDDDSVLEMMAELDSLMDNEFQTTCNIDDLIKDDSLSEVTNHTDEFSGYIETVDCEHRSSGEEQEFSDVAQTVSSLNDETSSIGEIARSQGETKCQVYTVTVTKQLKHLNDKIVDSYVSVEKDYFECDK